MRGRVAVGTVIVGLTFSLLGATPAYAHYVSVYHGADNAWVYSGHLKAGVQDNECDGHAVRAELYTADGQFYRFGDPNGCSQGAGSRTSLVPITQVRVCEAGVGCSRWIGT